MKDTIRLINYWIYNLALSAFIIVVSAFMIFDMLNGGSGLEKGHVLKYALSFIIFGAFLAGSTFFNQKLVRDDFHPASLLFVVVGLVYIFIGTFKIQAFHAETPETMLNLNFPLWLVFVAGAIFVLLINNKNVVGADDFFTVTKIINIVILAAGILAWYFLHDLEFVGPICFIVSAVFGLIRAIPAYKVESDHDLLCPW